MIGIGVLGVLGGNRRCSYVVRSAEEIVRPDIPVESTPIPQITHSSLSRFPPMLCFLWVLYGIALYSIS